MKVGFLAFLVGALANSHEDINKALWLKESAGKKVFLKLYGSN